MKVIYHSALITKEICDGCPFYAIPGKAYLEIVKERGDQEHDILLNGEFISPDDTIEVETGAEVVVRARNGVKSTYTVIPLANELSNTYAMAYEQFQYDYIDKPDNEIESIRAGLLRMYAVDYTSNVYDWTDTFDKIEDAFKSFKAICEKPKSHLKSVNEVRPIETIKRVGYESIPYLASHSEDWLARTASGLKPARLFSRAEDDEYQIYENRVVKTLIDLIISFLRKREKELEYQYEQLHGIMNSSVQTGSFGFDASFQKAVSELIVSDADSDNRRSKSLELAQKLYDRSKHLLKKYRSLRSTRLYRYLKKSKPIYNPLNETNILLMDKHYNVIFVLWKEIHKVIAPEQVMEVKELSLKYTYDDYLLFCKTLCGYAAHVLNFDIKEDGSYIRQSDNLSLNILEADGVIKLEIKGNLRSSTAVPNGYNIPLNAGESYESFYYDGKILSWDTNIHDESIRGFCEKVIVTVVDENAGYTIRHEQSKQRNLEQQDALKLFSLIRENRRSIISSKTIIVPAVVELENSSRKKFEDYAISCGNQLADSNDADFTIISLPVCNEAEQKTVNYAKCDGEKVLVLPLTMFDINSFRRMQNIVLRMILALNTGRCSSCGGRLRASGNQFVCDFCNQLILTETICPHPDCRHKYRYLSYNVTEETISKMQNVDNESFYQLDSLYQYKDVVPMSIGSGKLRTICPRCRR